MASGWMKHGVNRNVATGAAILSLLQAVAGCGQDSAVSGTSASDAKGGVSMAEDAAMADIGAGDSYYWRAKKDAAAATDMSAADAASWYGAADDTSEPADAAVAMTDAGGGAAVPADDQKRAWRKQVDIAPLASVSVGGDKKLELQAMRITVQVEGLRARTLVDHIFHNPYAKVTEGKFRYALPADATVSYYAMFGGGAAVKPTFFGDDDKLKGLSAAEIAAAKPEEVALDADPKYWADLKEGRIVAQEVATQVFEAETAKKVDPALVEELAPNTFEAKVFPIAADGYNRVLIAFEQTVPRVNGAYEYTFVVPKGDVAKIDFTLIAKNAAFAAAITSGNLPTITTETKGYLLHQWTQTASKEQPNTGGMLAVDLTPANDNPASDVLTGKDPTNGNTFAFLRLHPTIAALATKKAASEQAIFMLDTSASEGPGRFDVDIKLMTLILEKSSTIKEFQIVTFDAGARWLSAQWLANTPQGRKQALDLLDGALLEGATNFAAALHTLAKPPMQVTAQQVDVMVLSDGVVDLAETSAQTLLGRWLSEAPFVARFFAYRLGIGGDNVALFQALTRKGGAVFNCLTGADLQTCAVAHEAPGMTVDSVTIEGSGSDGAQVSDVLVAGRQATLFPGANLTIAARVTKPGAAIVHIKGIAPGVGPLDVAVPVTLQVSGELAARAWAEIAVAQLLETHEVKFEGLALALSQHYGIVSRIGSFLVLDSKDVWKKYSLDGETLALGNPALDKLLATALAVQAAVQNTWQQLYAQLKIGNTKSKIMAVDGGKLIENVQNTAQPADLELPANLLEVPLVKLTADVPAAYLATLKSKAAFVVDGFSDEGERRRKDGQIGAAVRALSTALEFNPGDAEIERLVGWRVRSWQQPALAAGLFLDVLRKRPFEPQSYRDLATTLGILRPGLTMLLYEAVIAGDWNPKFKAVKTVVMEEYAMFIQALTTADPKNPLLPYLATRSKDLKLQTPTGDLRVTITWNTDNVDIDLWVTDPLKEKCFYGHRDTASGGHLLDDLTEGFGPERFFTQKALSGQYLLQAHYYNNNGNLIEATTYVSATVVTKAGTPAQSVQTYDFVLHKKDDVVAFATVTFK